MRPAPGRPSLGQGDLLQLQKKTSGKDADAGSWNTLEWLPAEAKRTDSLCKESNSHSPCPRLPGCSARAPSGNPHKPWHVDYYYFHFTDKNTEAPRGLTTCPQQ